MAKCSTKGCKKGAVGRIQKIGTATEVKSRPACATCISQSQDRVKLNDNVKIAESDVFLNQLHQFAHDNFCDKDALVALIKDEEFSVFDELAVANVVDHRGSFRYKLEGIRYLVYVGNNFRCFNHKDETSTLVKYRINENTIGALFPSEN